MATIIERHQDNIQRAIQYVDEKLRENPSGSLQRLISEASARHNLSPKDEAFLQTVFKDRQTSAAT